MRDVAAAESLIAPAVVRILVTPGSAVELVGGLDVVQELRPCIVRQERKAGAQTFLGAHKAAVIRRVADRRIDEAHITELREGPPGLRIARAHKLWSHLVDAEVVAC